MKIMIFVSATISIGSVIAGMVVMNWITVGAKCVAGESDDD